MSRAPTLAGLEDEVRLLRESQKALEAAVAAAEQGRDATGADLAELRRRLTAKTKEALPYDAAICQRITVAIESACATAGRSLSARWDEIVRILRNACRRVAEELTQAERGLAGREAVR